MSDSDRGDELIQKYFESLATEQELAELERLLATSPEVAAAFAEMARLHAGLHNYFQRQYKIDQVAGLLQAAESESNATVGPPVSEPDTSAAGTSAPATSAPGTSARTESPARGPLAGRSTFVPVYSHRVEISRRRRSTMIRLGKVSALLLLVIVSAVVWLAERSASAPLRIISGRVSVAGNEVDAVPVTQVFEVVGREQAVIELPGGALIKLAPASRASILRSPERTIVRLKAGGGDFVVQADQAALRVETEIGVVTAASGSFSLELVTTPVGTISSPTAVRLPGLAVVVVEGSITFEQGGRPTILLRGEQRVFSNAG